METLTGRGKITLIAINTALHFINNYKDFNHVDHATSLINELKHNDYTILEDEIKILMRLI